jgi:hypothetical protein
MYNGYLTIARRALETNKPSLAENYTNEAWKYQQLNKTEIITPSEAFNLYHKIALSFMKNGHENISQKRYLQALNDFSAAQRICNINTDIPRPEKLSQLINEAHKGVYENIVVQAYQNYRQGNLIEAEQKVVEALAYQNQNPDAITSSIGTDTLMARIRYQTYMNSFIGESNTWNLTIL